MTSEPHSDATRAEGHASIVDQFATRLERSADGIWRGSGQSSVSYPDDGNAVCAEIEAASFWFRHRNRVIATAVNRYPPPASPIFDLGGGNGFVALGLEALGFRTVLVEPGPVGARTASQRGVRDVICATVETAGFRPGSLPAAGLFDVLEHVENDLGFLQTIRTALRPDGRLYLTVPAFQWLWSNEDEHAGHFRRYTVQSLRGVLDAAGFRIDYIGYFFALLTPALFLLRTLPSALGLRRSCDADSTRREHGANSPRTGRLMAQLLDFEIARIQRGLPLPLGTSCLCVARPR